MISPFPFFIERGSPINVHNKLKTLLEAGHQIDLICYPFGKNCFKNKNLKGKIKIHRVKKLSKRKAPIGISWKKIANNLNLIRLAYSLIRKNDYHIIHGHEIDGALVGLIAKKLSQRGTPLIYDMHSLPIDRMNKLFLPLQNWVIKNSELVMGIAPSFEKYCNDNFLFVFDMPIKEKENFKEKKVKKIRSKIKRPIIFYMGTTEDYQGIMEVDKHWEKDTGSLVCYSNTDKKFENAINIKNKGYNPSDSLMSADILLSPRKYGTNIPLKIYPYLRSGKPMVVTDIPAHDILTHKKNCIKAKSKPKDIIKKIKELSKKRKLMEKLGKNAKQTYKQNFNKKEYKKRVLDSYEQIKARHKHN